MRTRQCAALICMNKISPYWLLAVPCALSIFLWWKPLLITFSWAMHSDEYSQILVILPVSIGLIYLQRKALQPAGTVSEWEHSLKTGRIVSAILFIAAIALFIVSRSSEFAQKDISLTLSITGLVLWWLASFLSAFGWSAFRKLFFPLCFLFWMVPWTHSFLDIVITWLQQYSASGTRLFFEAASVPVLQQGATLSIPGLMIEVAKECSSIRSSLALLITTMLLGHLTLRSHWNQLWLTLIAVPLSVAKNALRIFTLAMLGLHVDPGFLTGRLHHDGGFVFFAIALGVIFLLAKFMQQMENRTKKPDALKVVAS